MSLVDENPEWFNNWIELQAILGRFGVSAQEQVVAGEITGSDLWEEHPDLYTEAETTFLERLVM